MRQNHSIYLYALFENIKRVRIFTKRTDEKRLKKKLSFCPFFKFNLFCKGEYAANLSLDRPLLKELKLQLNLYTRVYNTLFISFPPCLLASYGMAADLI